MVSVPIRGMDSAILLQNPRELGCLAMKDAFFFCRGKIDQYIMKCHNRTITTDKVESWANLPTQYWTLVLKKPD